MGALWMKLRAEARGRWRTWLLLAVLAGVPAGIAIAAATGALRTGTVTDRLVAATDPPDIFMVPEFQNVRLDFDDVATLPVVSEAFLFHLYGVEAPSELADLEVSAPLGSGLTADRAHLLEGRLPRADAVDEATITFKARERYNWKVGDVVRLRFAAPSEEGEDAPPGPEVAIRIVGVDANVGDFVGVAGAGMSLSPGFAKAYDAQLGSYRLYMLSLPRGGADVPEFERELEELSGQELLLFVDGRLAIAQVRRSFNIQAAALWVSSVFLAAVGALIFAQSAARQTLLDSREHNALGALGMTRGDMRLLAFLKAVIVAVAAVVVAAVLAAALSPLTPFGLPRLAEPDPGFSVPAATFGGGLAIAFLTVLILAFVPAFRIRGGVAESQVPIARPSAIARALSFLTGRPGPAVGARFALEAGRGATAVPVRSSLAASVTGIAALMAALTVGASLSHLLVTPRLYGWNWDEALSGDFERGSDDLGTLIDDPAISDVGVAGGFEGSVFRIGSTSFGLLAAESVKGNIGPTLLRGRIPTADDEIALGPKTIQTVGARLGGSVEVGVLSRTGSRPLRVVGEVVLPFDDDISTVGEGAWMTLSGAAHFFPETYGIGDALIRFAPGVDRAEAAARLKERFPDETLSGDAPQTIKDYGRISSLPAILAGLLAALAAGTLAHMLTSSIRRRRRDFAILKTLGFARGQVRSAIGSQALVFMSVALAVAIPAGAVVGRWTWALIARGGGFAAEPTLPVGDFLIVVASSFAAALLLAIIPGRVAARTQPALVLRTE